MNNSYLKRDILESKLFRTVDGDVGIALVK